MAVIALVTLGNPAKFHVDLTQTLVLLWLGAVASGVGYFMWNKGACEVDSGVLAIMNNALIPAAIIVNLVFWQKDTNLTRLILGAVIMYISLLIHNRVMKFYGVKAA